MRAPELGREGSGTRDLRLAHVDGSGLIEERQEEPVEDGPLPLVLKEVREEGEHRHAVGGRILGPPCSKVR